MGASVDFHCHLDLYQNPLSIAKECGRDGSFILSVTTTPKAWHGTRMLAGTNRRIKTALGLHPQIAQLRIAELSLFDSLISETRYLGEIGLDGGTESKPHWRAQLKVFDHILASASRNGGRILSIHSRRSATAVLDALERQPDAGVPVFHWFSGTKYELKRAIDMGCWFSVGSAMAQSKRAIEMISIIPRDRIITETDGPFGTVNGKPLHPGDTHLISEVLHQCWSVDRAEVARQVLESFRQLVSTQVGGSF
jgi:TatD DNase family protein